MALEKELPTLTDAQRLNGEIEQAIQAAKKELGKP